MTKKNLFRTIAIAFLLFMLVGLIFFRKGDDKVPKSINDWQVESLDKKQELMEEERARMMAENFITTYYSYTWGDFSNVESQYYYMTDGMKGREEVKVEKMKKEIEGQPQRYFTARAELLDSEIVLFTNTKIKLNVNLSVSDLSGAIVQRDTSVWVDENGDYYEGNPDNLIIDTVEKNIQINLIKISNEWRVNEINN